MDPLRRPRRVLRRLRAPGPPGARGKAGPRRTGPDEGTYPRGRPLRQLRGPGLRRPKRHAGPTGGRARPGGGLDPAGFPEVRPDLRRGPDPPGSVLRPRRGPQHRRGRGRRRPADGDAARTLVAKIASDREKPGGIVLVPSEGIADFLAPLPIRVVPGVGPKTEARLLAMGLKTLEEVG